MTNNALAEGRLTAEEHSDRLDAIYPAKTHADLVPLLAILSGVSRKGRWHPEPVPHVLFGARGSRS